MNLKLITKRVPPLLLALLATSLIAGCGQAIDGSGVGFSADTPTSLVSNTGGSSPGLDPGAQSFLARSGFLGFASINDRALGQNRFLVYHSRADLLPEDTNGTDDIYLRDTRLGTTTLVSVHTDGTQGDGPSTQASISADGRFVVFRSAATNLVAGDGNGFTDIFLRDLRRGTTTRVSVDSGGGDSNGQSLTPAISNVNGGAQYVVFASEATNLVATADTNTAQDIFVRDVIGNSTTLISTDSTNAMAADGASHDPAITPDGSEIAFSTLALDAISGGLNGQRHVVRVNRAAPATRALISRATGVAGAQANGPCYEPSMSDDGSIIAFFTNADNLGTDTNTFFDVYVRNGSTTTRATVDSGGGESNGHSGFPSISGDGSVVSFGSLATDLVASDGNGVFDVFTREGTTTTRISVDTAGTAANVDSDLPAISSDGRFVAFRSAATNLDGNDTGADDDIYVRDRTTPTTVLHSIACRILAAFSGFTAAVDFAVGGRPISVTAGDFDGDGHLDLATANIDGRNVSVLLGDGTGGFGGATNFAVGEEPVSITSGDFDGDGHLDLTTANIFDESISVLLGNGTGGFGSTTNFALGTQAASVTSGDFDGDGHLDLATTNGNRVSVLLGDGTGNFGSATNFAVGNIPFSVISGDFDGDGNLDLATANDFDANVSVLLGDGTGSFGSATNFAVGDFPRSVTSGDLDGDGHLDLTTANVVDDNISVLLGDGTGSFGSATNFAVGDQPNSVTSGDFDGDGHLDLATANINDDNVSVILNLRPDWAGLATAVNTAAGSGPRAIVAGDVDGDGDLDLANANADGGNLTLLLNDGSGGLSAHPSSPFAVGTTPENVNFADIDGDGDLDLAAVNNGSNDITLLVNNGSGTYTAHPTSPITVGSNPKSLDFADIDDDGDLDLACCDQGSNQVTLLLNNGGGTYTAHPSSPLTVGTAPESLEFGDLDGDGDRDLAVCNIFSDDVSILLNDGSGNFGTATNFAAGDGPTGGTLGDLDSDGDLDLMVRISNVRALGVMTNNGNAVFSPPIVVLSTLSPENFLNPSLGDLDGDGDLGIAVGQFFGADTTVLLNGGSGKAWTPLTFPAVQRAISIVLSDLDGDGDLDLANANRLDDNVSILLNQACP